MAPRAAAPMTRGERIIFAAGDIFGGGGGALIGVLYLFYLTDVMRLSPALAGAAVLVPRIWDAINDPLVGTWSDNTRTRWGRRRPFITVGALLLVVGIAAIWAPIGGWESQGAKAAFVIAANLFYTTVATTVAVPYGSLSSEISTDYDERNQVNVMRLAFSTVSSAGCTLAGSWLTHRYTSGVLSATELYTSIVIGFGLLFGVPSLLVGLFTRERAPIPDERSGISLDVVLSPLRQHPFRQLLALYLCQAITMDVISALIIYFSLYVVHVTVMVFLGMFIVVNLVAFPIVNQLVRHVSKATIYRRLLPLALVAAVGIGLYPREAPAWGVYLLGALLAIGMCGAVLMSWVIFPDVMDAAELATDERNAGTFAGLMTLVRGLASALAIALIGVMLQLTGYASPEDYANPVQPVATLWGIRLTLAGAVVVLMSIGWMIARRFALTRSVCQTMQDELAARRAQG